MISEADPTEPSVLGREELVRGQLAAHYARLGVQYPNTDHINYLLVNKL
ncbi:MAG TPA: hypothetical protein VH439_16830 [Gemmatimonadales bacterium]|jgi:hypothetical protein